MGRRYREWGSDDNEALHTAAYYCILPHTAAYCCILPHTAAYCCMLLHTAAYYCILLHTAAYCCILPHTAALLPERRDCLLHDVVVSPHGRIWT